MGATTVWSVLKNILFTLGVIGGGVSQTVTLPLWVGTFGKALGGPYFILWISSLFFIGFFGVCALVIYFTKKPSTPKLSEYWKILLPIGVLNAANGIGIVYASPASRTPPLLQGLLLNVSILFSMPATKLFVKEKAHINYFQLLPSLALVSVFSGIVVSLLPKIISIAHGEKDGGEIWWSLVFMLGVMPGSLYNVLQEKFLKIRASAGIERQNSSYDKLVMLFWGCLFQFLTISALFWVDVIPGFGFSPSLKEFGHTFYESARCFVDQEPGCQNNWWLGVLFNLGYIISYLCAAALNEESANYNMIAFTLVSPVTVTFWLVFSSLNPNNENTPIWSVLPALALLISGTVLWKYWEFREDKKSAKSFDVQGDLEREPILRAKTF
jgi:drug/metabolite transporter (DMT)-like permease